ncbi:hypothetical protein BsWGS_05176 [Bradybaena similaris]
MVAIREVMTVLLLCVLLALTVMATSAETCTPGLPSKQCLDKQPPCGYCGEFINITLIVNNAYSKPVFTFDVKVENEPQQPLLYFLQKAALLKPDFGFSAKYYGTLGYMVETINKLTASATAKTYWSIFSVTNNTFLPCGVSSYIPLQKEVILFNFTTYGANGAEEDTELPQCTSDECN